MRCTRWIFVWGLLLAGAVPLAAQEREIRDANLPHELETRLLRLYDRSTTQHITGDAYIPASEHIRGDVGAMGGPLHVAGRIDGDLAMVNGDIVLEPTAVVRGDVLVVGGEARMAEGAEVLGTVTTYGRAEHDRRAWHDRDRDRDRTSDGWAFHAGDSRLVLRAGTNYNRVEGLPIMFGPVIETAGSNPLRLDAMAIWRSESNRSFAADRMGYRVRAEQYLGGHRAVSVGGSFYSVVQPMDRWQTRDLEASLGALVFRQDLRDYYERKGASGFVRFNPVRALDARVEYRRDEDASLAAGNPWSLFDRKTDWRLQPLVAEGSIGTAVAEMTIDLRDDDEDPYSGWWINGMVQRAVDGELTRPGIDPSAAYDSLFMGPVPTSFTARTYAADFTTAFIDIRRYMPVGYASQLNLRVVGGGALTNAPLPPQFQHALGGIGTLPGYDQFEADCGARLVPSSRVQDGTTQNYFPSYGCDRFALFQAEYRGRLSLDLGFGDSWHEDHWSDWRDWNWDVNPSWVVFFDAGRGWTNDTGGLAGLSRNTGWLYDAGLGLLIDRVGLYAAFPLTDGGGSTRFFLRLDHRF
jgi:hypothetical protein